MLQLNVILITCVLLINNSSMLNNPGKKIAESSFCSSGRCLFRRRNISSVILVSSDLSL